MTPVCRCGAPAEYDVWLDDTPEGLLDVTAMCRGCLDVVRDAVAPFTLSYRWPVSDGH